MRRRTRRGWGATSAVVGGRGGQVGLAGGARVAAAGGQAGPDRLQLHRGRDEADIAALLHEPPDPPVVVVLLL